MAIPTLATYGGIELSPAYAGEIIQGGPQVVESRMNENATAIDFGVAVTAGVATGAGVTPNCKPLVTNGQAAIGISVRNPAGLIATTDGANTINYPQYQAVPVLKLGTIAAIPFENVVAQDGVIALPAQSGQLSGTTAGAANGTSRMAVTGAVWQTTTLAGAVGILRIVTA